MIVACINLQGGVFLTSRFMGRMSVAVFVLMLAFWRGGEPYVGRSPMWGRVMPAGSPGMALPGPAVVRPGFSLLVLLLPLSHRRRGQCSVWVSAPRFPLCALPHSTITASGRSRAPQPACRPAPPAARRCRRPERPRRRSVCACILLTGTRDTATEPPRHLPVPGQRLHPALQHPLHTPLRCGTATPRQLPPTPPRCCGPLST